MLKILKYKLPFIFDIFKFLFLSPILVNRFSLVLFILFLSLNLCQSQILTFDFAGLTGSEVSATSNFNNANLTASTITRGAGLTASGNADRYNAVSWNTTSIASAVTNNDYMQFTISPQVGYQFSISSITIQVQRSGTGISSLALRSSADTYASNLDAVKTVTDNTSTQLITFTFAQSPACDASITYRLYGTAEDVTGSGGIGDFTGNDIVVNGTVSTCGASTFSVTYNGNGNTGGSVPIDASSPYASGSSVTVLGNTGTLTKTSCTFNGWNTASDGSGTSYAAASSFNISANTTLYAQWDCPTVCSSSSASTVLSSCGTNYCQLFNTSSASVPSGWVFRETGSNANSAFSNGTGTGTVGDTYFYGSTSEWSLGALQTGSLLSSFGASFTNNTGSSITSLLITYKGETWRVGTGSRADRLDFQYSLDATSLNSGTWTDVNGLDYQNPGQATGSGSLLHSATISSTISSLNITCGSTFWIRWSDFDASGADDGMAIDDFSLVITCGAACTTFNVTYNSNGGTGSQSDPINYASGAAVTVLSQGTIARAGYTFVGYNTASDGSGASYSPGDVFSINSNTVLYAQWTLTPTGSSNDPQIEKILVNSCSSDEGLNEFFIFKNGNQEIDVNSMVINFPTGGEFCNSGCSTNTLGNAPAKITSLNTTAGCALFIYSSTIPVGATVVVFTSNQLNYNYNFSASCPGPYYAIFCNNSSTTGRFGNNNGSGSGECSNTRTLAVDFGYATDVVSYMPGNNGAGCCNTCNDGDYAIFDPAGNASYGNQSSCAVPLPIELINFNVFCSTDKMTFQWSTLSERNNDFFTLEESFDGIYFYPIMKVNGAGNSSTQKDYSSEIINDHQNKYYRLKQTDFDGAFSYSKIISSNCLNKESLFAYPNPGNGLFNIVGYENNSILTVHDELGRLIIKQETTKEITKINLDNLATGIYFITSTSEFTTETIKINLVH